MQLSLEQIIETPVDSLNSQGQGVAHHNGITLFIDGALPMEVVQAQIYQIKKRYACATAIKIIKPSPVREDKPPCIHFGSCGGCHLMHLSYPAQLEEKGRHVKNCMERIAKLSPSPAILPCISSPQILAYRNKVQINMGMDGDNIIGGFYALRSHSIVAMESCPIHLPLGDQAYQAALTFLRQESIVPYDESTRRGTLRRLWIRTTQKTQEVLLVFITTRPQTKILQKIAKKLMDTIPSIVGVLQNIQPSRGNTTLSSTFITLGGRSYVKETFMDLEWRLSPQSFFQMNTPQAETLYREALQMAELTGTETVVDGYCGTGTLSLVLSQHAQQVLGVDSVRAAIEDAKHNAQINGIENAHFHCGTMEALLPNMKPFQIIFLDPPRKGCDRSVLETIARVGPQKIIYISCDPATLARDLAILQTHSYHVKKIQPLDMFPQTSHVECVALIERL